MKELVKPNNLEDSYQKAEQFCETGYESGCTGDGCYRERVRSIDEVDDILF